MQRRLRDGAVRRLFPPVQTRSQVQQTPESDPPRRILILRPDQLGDLLFATPALAYLRAAYPDAHLTGLVGPWGRPIWERQPALDAVETLPFPGIVARPRRPWEPYTLLRAAAQQVRAGHYDLAVILRFDYWWGALLAEQAHIPRRYGYDLPVIAPYLSDALAYQASRHEVEQNLALAVAAAGPSPSTPPVHIDRTAGEPPLSFPITDEERTGAARLVQTFDPGGDAARRVFIHPGTNASLKLWTPTDWAAVTRWLLDRGYRVIFTGTQAEAPLIDAIGGALDPALREQAPSLAGATTVGQIGALFAGGLVLGVDSGPLHIATAVGARTLRLYGPSDETIWGPWGPVARNLVVRAPGTGPGHFLDPTRQSLEGGPEMLAIRPEQVIAVLERLLELPA